MDNFLGDNRIYSIRLKKYSRCERRSLQVVSKKQNKDLGASICFSITNCYYVQLH